MRILIVEDEVLVAMMLTDSLESGGCPEHGYTGREARRIMPNLPPRAP
jgi:CheY-like chemotaxis protein